MAEKRPRPQPGSADFKTSPPLATEWSQHEHVTPSLKAQAKKLVEEAGTGELAKYAVDAVTEPHPAGIDKDEFARAWGLRPIWTCLRHRRGRRP
jgi:hypothetical protein